MGSPAARGAALYRAKRSMGSALQRRRCRVVSRREMGEGPFGDSDASVEACRDRDLSEWGGMGLLEAKIFGLWHPKAAVLVGRGLRECPGTLTREIRAGAAVRTVYSPLGSQSRAQQIEIPRTA